MDFRKSPSLLLSMNHILRNYKSIIASRENLFHVGIASFDEENIMVLVSSWRQNFKIHVILRYNRPWYW